MTKDISLAPWMSEQEEPLFVHSFRVVCFIIKVEKLQNRGKFWEFLPSSELQ